MTAFIYILICLVCIVIQTTLFPLVAWLDGFYDLLIPFVVYLGLFRPLKEGLPVVFCLGIAMDTLSGGAFGIYSTTYLWLYGVIAWMIGFLHFKNTLLLPFVVVVGVLLENLVFLGAVKLGNPDANLPLGLGRTVTVQLLWALFTGPVLLLLIRSIHLGWTRWVSEKITEVDG
jgi:cell shape-determining protein MreD